MSCPEFRIQFPLVTYVVSKRSQDLPCGKCRFCRQSQEQWARFEEDFDDAVRDGNLTNQVLVVPSGDSSQHSSVRIAKVTSDDLVALLIDRLRREQEHDTELDIDPALA